MNYTFTTEDTDEATMLHHAAEAWDTLSEVRQTLRNQLKHGQDEDLRVNVEALYREVCLTLSRLE